MQTITDKISIEELKKLSEKMFGRLVKAVVDIERGIMVVDAELHSDQEEVLLESGSEQDNLWGINLHPDETGNQFVEFDSMINVRPSRGNRSRSVDDPQIREKIIMVVNRLVTQ